MRLTKSLLYLAAVVALAGAFSVGYLFGHRNLVLESSLVPKLVNTELGKPREVDFSLFWDVWGILNQKYIGTLNPQDLVYGAIRGMVAAVGDPYTVFLPPDESQSFLDDLSGKFEGIGAEIAIRQDRLIIVAPLEDSPAERAGLKPRDWILAIDGESTEAMTLTEATSKIRGRAGTTVKLTILSEGSREPREVAITRAKIQVDSAQLSYRPTPDGREVAYVKIVQFGPDTADKLSRFAEEITRRRVAGVVVDVRNNPGGYLEAAIDVTSLLVAGDVIVKERKKDGTEEVMRRTLEPRLANLPLVVLINEGSASASEILAGAVQDYGRGPIIGETSFGKGSVQDLEQLKGGSSLRVTVAKWLTPKGREINEQGITPDITVPRTEEDIDADRDPQLDRAIEELTK